MVVYNIVRSVLIIAFIGAGFSAQSQHYIQGDYTSYKINTGDPADRYFFPDNTSDCFQVEICGIEKGITLDFFSGLLYASVPLELNVIGGGERLADANATRILTFDNCISLKICAPDRNPASIPYLSWSQLDEEGESIPEFTLSRSSSGDQPIGWDGSASADELVRDILIGGNCFDVHNIIPIGPDAGRGMFFDGLGSIGIERGIVLSTGNLRNIEGPNGSSARGNNMGGDGDDDLVELTSQQVYDAVGIQFDFVPTSDTARFRYVFASEEYCEFVGQGFNDVFGFFVSGPGINGEFSNNAVNIALIPGTSDFVSIDNVNRSLNSEYYFDNTTQNQVQSGGGEVVCGPLLDQDGIAVELVEFDGFTAVFEATVVVIPCETYTIKMVVGDVADASYDSAVFLEAGSFDAGASARLDATVSGVGGNIVYDHCLQGSFIVTRIGNSDITQPVVVRLNYSTESTAIPGVDFEGLPDSVIIPPFQDSLVVPINILTDTYSGGELSVVYELDFLCSCTNPFAEIIISDNTGIPKMNAFADDFLSCANEEVFVFGEILEPDFITNFEWRDGEGNLLDDGSNDFILVSQPGTYLLIGFNEMSGCVDTAIATVEIDRDVPTATIEEPEIIDCDTESISLDGSGSSVGPSIFYSWSTTEGELIGGEDEISATVTRPGWYFLEVINIHNGCQVMDSVQVLMDAELPVINLEPYGDLNCRDREIDLVANSSEPTGELSFNWEVIDGAVSGSTDQPTLTVTEPGVYELEIILERNGCSVAQSFTVSRDVVTPEVSVGEDILLPCVDPVVDLRATGINTGPEPVINWASNEGGNLSGPVDQWETEADETGIYIVTVTNPINYCSDSDTLRVYQDLPVDANLEILQPVCPGDLGYLSVLSVEGGTFPYTYELSQRPESNDHGWFENLSYRTYELTITDELGCEYQTAFNIVEPREIQVVLEDSDVAELGRPYPLDPSLNFPESELGFVQWTPSGVLDCPDCLRPNAEIMEPIKLNLYVEDIYGCPASASIQLWLVENTNIFVPNAFSPNDDGINDFIDVYSDRSVKEILELVIYNRWGLKVFHRVNFPPNEKNFGWDGTINGEKAEPGVYIYTLEYVLINGHEGRRQGEITLLR